MVTCFEYMIRKQLGETEVKKKYYDMLKENLLNIRSLIKSFINAV